MARPGVTYLDVSNVAQQLTAAGKIPTIDSIRIALGSTGSKGTIGAHLRVWKAKQGQDQQIACKEKLPDVLIATMRGLWELVMNQSEEQIQSIKQKFQQDLALLKQELQRLQRENMEWQQQHQQLQEERAGLSNEKSSLQQRLISTQVELAAWTEKHAGLEEKIEERQTRIDELHRQNQQIQANLEHYREASAEQRQIEQQRYEQQIKQLDQVVFQVNQELADTRRERIEFQQKYQQIAYERDNFKEQLDKLIQRHECLTKNLADTTKELAINVQSKQHWQEQYRESSKKLDDQNQLIIERQTQYAVLLKNLEITELERFFEIICG